LSPTADPGTGETIGSLPEQGLEDTRLAIDQAYDAFQTWGKTTEYERAAILNKMYKCVRYAGFHERAKADRCGCRLMTDNAEDLAQILTAENGKPLVDARGEVAYGASFLEWFASEAVRNYGDVIPSSVKGVTNLVVKQPVGVCGISTSAFVIESLRKLITSPSLVTPWNVS
jgi:succinate-semialdehyde dehydrogenase/glutarate-semialdehyde dehydrogenase